jgi:hypothetical protein
MGSFETGSDAMASDAMASDAMASEASDATASALDWLRLLLRHQIHFDPVD